MKTFVNMLPWSYRRREMIRLRLFQWSLVWGIGIALAVSIWWLKHSRYQEEHRALQLHEEEYAPLQKLQADDAQIQARLNELGAKDTLVGQLQEQPPPLAVLGLVSGSAQKCGGRIWLKNLTFQWMRELATPKAPEAAAPRTPATTVEPDAPGLITLQGGGVDKLAVAEFVGTLQETGAFGHVELKSSVGTDSSVNQDHSYLVECRF